MKRKSKLTIAIATTVLAVLGTAAVYAQDKYSLNSPSGIAFSDFKGYEDWAVVSSARTDEVLKVIVANPTMIEAYKAGVPDNGQPFPDGSKIVKLQWKPKKSTEAPFVVDVPDVFTQAFVIEKDSKRFPKTGGWGYALFNYDATTGTFAADAATADCGHSCHVTVKSKDHIFHVRRDKAALSRGCKPRPAIAPAGSNRGRHGGDEMSEAPDSGHEFGDCASVQAATRVNAEQSSKRTMCRPTRKWNRGRLTRMGEILSEEYAPLLHRGSGGSMYTRKAPATREAPTRDQG